MERNDLCMNVKGHYIIFVGNTLEIYTKIIIRHNLIEIQKVAIPLILAVF